MVESPNEDVDVTGQHTTTEDPAVAISETTSAVDSAPEREETEYEEVAQSASDLQPQQIGQIADTNNANVQLYASSETEESQDTVSEPSHQETLETRNVDTELGTSSETGRSQDDV